MVGATLWAQGFSCGVHAEPGFPPPTVLWVFVPNPRGSYAAYLVKYGSDIGMPCTEPTDAIVVDLGSGEFKRFICSIQEGKAVTLLKENKDKSSPVVYQETLAKLVEDLYVYYHRMLKEMKVTNVHVEPDESTYGDAFDKINTAILGDILKLTKSPIRVGDQDVPFAPK
jgi:hypothetical protein